MQRKYLGLPDDTIAGLPTNASIRGQHSHAGLNGLLLGKDIVLETCFGLVGFADIVRRRGHNEPGGFFRKFCQHIQSVAMKKKSFAVWVVCVGCDIWHTDKVQRSEINFKRVSRSKCHPPGLPRPATSQLWLNPQVLEQQVQAGYFLFSST